MGVAGLSPKLEGVFLYLKSEDNICKALVNYVTYCFNNFEMFVGITKKNQEFNLLFKSYYSNLIPIMSPLVISHMKATAHCPHDTKVGSLGKKIAYRPGVEPKTRGMQMQVSYTIDTDTYYGQLYNIYTG